MRCPFPFPGGCPIPSLGIAIPEALQLYGLQAPPTSGCRLSLAASAAMTLFFYGVGECV